MITIKLDYVSITPKPADLAGASDPTSHYNKMVAWETELVNKALIDYVFRNKDAVLQSMPKEIKI